MSFTTGTIGGQSLNVTMGANYLLFALSEQAYVTMDFSGYAPYHSSKNNNRTLRPAYRGLINLNLVDGSIVTGTGTNTPVGASMRIMAPAALLLAALHLVVSI